MTHYLSARETRSALPWTPLIDGIGEMFRTGCEMPIRHHHEFKVPGEGDGTLLLMPAWISGSYIGVKMVNVIPGNSTRGLAAISGVYLLSSATTGELLAIMDGAELTARRTAAASALAARFLARKNASRLLIVGAGRLSLNLIQAHSQVRPVTSVKIWARRPEQAAAIAAQCQTSGKLADVLADVRVEVVPELEPAVRSADIISCCTLANKPLVLGKWLQPGTHLDLVGAFKSTMRESDDEAVTRSSIFVDTRGGALSEAGDLLQPINAGLIDANDIKADLYDLCRQSHAGRSSDSEITLFKSVGAALEDLAAAAIAYTVFEKQSS